MEIKKKKIIYKIMYFSHFRKNTPGRKKYGWGFVFMFKHHTFLIGTKKIDYRNSHNEKYK
tara:strand:+ start:719 stop:898 length:180 start_codon:yes stop_codon:yes gene_type:complete